MAEPKLALIARKNIKENEEKLNELKDRIAAVAGIGSEITFDLGYPALAGFVDKNGYQNRVGEVATWWIGGLADNFEKIFADETAKASLQAVWTTGVIRLVLGTLKKGESGYHKTDIENGDLVITVYSVSNTSDTGNDLLAKLGDDSGVSVKTAQDIKKAEEEKTEKLNKIKEATGIGADVTVDIDWVAFAGFVDKAGYNDRAGECLNWFIGGLADNVERQFTDDTAKAAIQAVWTTGVIRVALGTNKKGEHKYHSVAPENGDLIITVYQLSNTSDTGSDLLGKLGDPDTGLSLKAALNVKEYAEKKEENLAKIKEAVGGAAEITIDTDWKVLEPLVNKLGYNDRVGEVVYSWILGGLADNLQRICKEELSKEAIAETWTTGVIRLAENKKAKTYHDCNFVDGDLVIEYKPDSFCSNVSDTGNDIESKL